jgi:hypothetical protein
MANYNQGIGEIPRPVLYRSRVVASRDSIIKNRDGNQSKMQGALARLKQHLNDDEIVLVIRKQDLQVAVLDASKGFEIRTSTPPQTFNQSHTMAYTMMHPDLTRQLRESLQVAPEVDVDVNTAIDNHARQQHKLRYGHTGLTSSERLTEEIRRQIRTNDLR